MRTPSSAIWLTLGLALACSADPEAPSTPAPSAGAPGSGGNSPTGGSAPSTGGVPGTGGKSAGGGGPASGGGGASATGGLVNNAGSTTLGGGAGAGAGGGPGNGGRGGGGAASTGGSAPTGGVAQGGSGGGGGAGAGGMSTDAATVYAASCSPCHGPRGEGVPMMGPDIQHPVRDFSTWVVRNGRQGNTDFPKSTMAAFAATALPDATLNAMFDWLSTPALPKPTTGQALYVDYCANCHGADGAGGSTGRVAKGEPESKAISMVRSGHELMQMSVRREYMPKWSASELTDNEIGLIVDYLDSL